MEGKTKKLILDTDLGGDCDDAVALALVNHLMNLGRCSLELITLSIRYDGGCATARAINHHYRNGGVKIGAGEEKVACVRRAYSRHIMEKYGFADDSDGNPSALMRQVLAAAEDKVSVVAIGPLTNLSALYRSGPDEISPLTGRELIERKVEAFYVMGGSALDMVEFNVGYDLPASENFFAMNTRVKTFLIPWEMGEKVMTGETLADPGNPALECVRYWNYYELDNRSSWDSITCAVALLSLGCFGSRPVEVSLQADGKTVFREAAGGNYRLCYNFSETEEIKRDLEVYLK